MAAIIEDLMSAIMEGISALLSALGKIIEGLVEAIEPLASSGGRALFSGFSSAANSLWDFLSNRSMPALPSISLDFVTHPFGRKIDLNLFQWDAADLLKDQTVSIVMHQLKVTQPQQSLATILYVGGKAGVKAGLKKFERTGNLGKSIEVARNEAAVKATGQAIREIPSFADAGIPAANYVEGKICDTAADVAEHELRRELSRR
jgi:hypothetical protein